MDEDQKKQIEIDWQHGMKKEKCKHCNQPNYYKQEYRGFCLECHNCGVEELLDEIAELKLKITTY